jgi:hypothetical protein
MVTAIVYMSITYKQTSTRNAKEQNNVMKSEIVVCFSQKTVNGQILQDWTLHIPNFRKSNSKHRPCNNEQILDENWTLHIQISAIEYKTQTQSIKWAYFFIKIQLLIAHGQKPQTVKCAYLRWRFNS